MPSTYTLNNGIELISTGEQSGTWGDTTNTNFDLVDTALDGQVSIALSGAGSSGSPNDLPISDGTSSNGRNRMITFTDGTDLGATAYVQLTPNDSEKIIYVRNDLSGSRNIILFQGTYNASNDYEVPAGTTAVVYFDGAGSGAVAANVFNNAYFDSLRLGGVSVTAIIDDDSMGTASGTNIATSESIKAYVDAQVGANNELSEVLANGNTTGGNNILFGDNDKAIFGAGSDLQIYHDGSNSYIDEVGTGSLLLRGVNLKLQNSNNGEDYLIANQNAAVTIFHDSAAKLATTATGIDVTGTVTADGLTVDGTGTAITLQSNNTAGSALNSLLFKDEDGSASADQPIGNIQFYSSDVNSPGVAAYITSLNGTGSTGDITIGTGIGGSAADRVKIEWNGDISFYEDTGTTPKFFWDASAESLGIGTASPGSTLEISATTAPILNFERQDSVNGNGIIRSVGNTGTVNAEIALGGGSNNLITFDTNGSEAMRIDSSGNVGIGTILPSSPLHIDTNADGNILQMNGASEAWDLIARSSNGTSPLSGEVIYSLGMYRDNGASSPNGVINFGRGASTQNGYLTFDVNGSEAMRIDSSGNVGIGTDSPGNIIEAVVADNEVYDGTTNLGSDASLRILNDSSTTGSYSALKLDSKNAGGNVGQWRISSISTATNYDNDLAFTTRTGASTYAERMRIDAQGNVGIGDTNPTHMFDVTGTGRFVKGGNEANLILETTDTDANAGPILELLRNPGQAGADNDLLGKVQFRGLNSASENTRFAEMTTRIIDASNGSEDGRISIDVIKDGALRSALSIDMGLSEVVVNESSVDVDFRVESNSDTHAFFVEGSTGNIGMSVSDPNSHCPQTHNVDKLSFVSYFNGGTQFICGRSDTSVVADDYIGGYLFKTNDGSNNKFGGMTAKVDDNSGNGVLEFYPVNATYDSPAAEGTMQLGDTNDLFLRAGGIRVGRSEKTVYTSSEESIAIYHNGGGTGDTHTAIVARDGTAGDHVFRHMRRGVTKSEIEENGDFLSATNSYTGTSDERLKENIVAASSQWDDIKALQFKNYSMIDAELDAPNMLGVMAQDLQASGMGGLVKQTFKTNGDDEPVLDADGNQEEYLSVKYSVLYLKAIKALQEAITKIETLETKVAALEGA